MTDNVYQMIYIPCDGGFDFALCSVHVTIKTIQQQAVMINNIPPTEAAAITTSIQKIIMASIKLITHKCT